ncbi:hypothetical protein Patl1_10199 [Pistacia atlantica]|uniref:Uncharacterized protein n=1 Tax=Pistacia atlantica TaxID=434234 RepID=A0ACC1A6N5_9ROSI|nr:hypothetical protein Patl1_10199 [Pistacia atlantica]
MRLWLLIDLWAMVMRSPLSWFVLTYQGLLVQLPPTTDAVFVGRSEEELARRLQHQLVPIARGN